VTTCPSLLSLSLGCTKYKLHLNPARLEWRAVCARHVDVFTGRCWHPITRNSSFMRTNCSPQSELRQGFEG